MLDQTGFVGRVSIHPPPAAYTRRAGELAVADDLFLVALDDRTGHHLADPGLLALGLAAGLLAELVNVGAVIVDGNDHVVPTGGLLAAADDTGRVVASLVIRERAHDLPTWLSYLARDAVKAVARRLRSQGLVTVHRHRRLIGSATTRYEATNANTVAYRAVRLTAMLTAHAHVPGDDVDARALLMIAHALGLTPHLTRDFRDHHERARDRVDQIHLEALITQPSLHRLAVALGRLVGAHATAPRR
ncbi:phage terminase small subunit [Allocatelliglobosispora scoriae]|uniref:Phage terminase small subunit n=1 Tax=Allocatelliglobosispora scoriae TaxID=643052 RepID=A0A841BMG5_9ACTN|nr:GPP34 family phosphoprotein [Allocatelliglobosispora scoriae]MBB5868568.1 phage terminase small subunit [Allocatelliglobosispora scoriae]